MNLKPKTPFETMVDDLFSAIHALLGRSLWLPALMLSYATIDVFAWLDLPPDRDDVTRADFKDWAERYILGFRAARFTSDDLYAARCGLLHSYQPESKMSREGKAKPIWYTWGEVPAESLQQVIDDKQWNAVAMHVEDVFERLKEGVQRFQHDMQQDENRSNRVMQRSKKFLSQVSYGGKEGDQA